jgi:hypothetical protein
VVGLGVRRGDYVRDTPTEHETEETFEGFVEVTSKHQTFIVGGVGSSKDYRMLIHDNQSH